jgi:PAS domain S-box-containing protein
MTLDLDGPGPHIGAGSVPHVGAGPVPHIGVDPLPLLCALPVAAAVFDAKGTLRCANPRLEQILAEGPFPAWPVCLAHTPAVLPASPEGLPGEAQEVLAGIRAVLEGEREQASIALRGGAPGAPSCEISVTQLRVDGARGALVCVHNPAAPRSEPATVPIESFLDTIIEHVPVSVFIKEVTEFRVVRMNGHYEKVFGAPRSDVLGKNVFDLFPHRLEEARWLDRMDRDVIEKGEIVDVPESRMATPTGERWLHMVKVPLKDEHGGVAREDRNA